MATFPVPRERVMNSEFVPFAAAASRVRPARNVVPICEDLMPAFASRPAAAATSLNSSPSDFAIGPTYFRPSPSSRTEVLELLAAAVRVSTTAEVSEVPFWNPPRAATTTSEKAPMSSPAAAAPSAMPGRACLISSMLKPARARATEASESWLAVNFVADARSVIALESSPKRSEDSPAIERVWRSARSMSTNLVAESLTAAPRLRIGASSWLPIDIPIP